MASGNSRWLTGLAIRGPVGGGVRVASTFRWRAPRLHGPGAAGGADAAALAGEGHEALGGAGVAADAGEAVGENAAAQVGAEVVLDSVGYVLAYGVGVGGLGEESPEVVPS